MILFKYIFVILILFSINTLNIFANEENESSDFPLEVETYLDGKNQLTHPSVISFEEEWNGYKYWMSYTPYPYANGGEENPSVAVSNDMLKWETPKGLANPIATNEELGCNELKDSHILYRDDLNRIEVWYLGRISKDISLSTHNENQLTIFRKYSYDGIHWSEYEIMCKTDYLSTSIIWKDNKYMIWQIGFDSYNTTGTIQYVESKDGYVWENMYNCSINGNSDGLIIWHGSVSYNEEKNIYEMVYIENGEENDSILYCKSNDGIHFDQPNILLKISNKWNRFYRPYLLFDEIYYIIYGVVTDNNEWYISMNKGTKLDTLNQLSVDEKALMIGLDYPELNKSIISKLKVIINNSKEYIRYEIYIVPIIVMILYIKYNKNFNLKQSIFIEFVFVLFYFFIRFGLNMKMSQIIAILFMQSSQILMTIGLIDVIKIFNKHNN